MSTKRATKRALLTSILAICLCLVMLIGSTFAWFTDTASTGVNKIQSGTLDVQLLMLENGQWVSAEGKTLEFKKAAGAAEGEKVLWEPGCRYELPELKVKNNGNLALKYKIAITGIDGDAKLLKAITWTINDAVLTPDTEYHLAANAESEPTLKLKGVMDTAAGNEYQGLTASGITVTVLATQDTVENDSFDNKYDEQATYPEVLDAISKNYTADGTKMPAGVEITSRDVRGKVTVTLKDEEAFLYFTQVFDMDAACAAREAALADGTVERYPGESVHNSLNIWYRAYQSVYVEMACDVDLNGINVTPFTEYSAFDGKGHTIKNASVSASGKKVGFFDGADISNVTLDNIQVVATAEQWAGVVNGYNSTSITNVTVTNSSVTGGYYAGAIAGDNYGHIENCTVSNCMISGQYKVGGLAAFVGEDAGTLNVTGNTLTNVTVKAENVVSGKTPVLGKLIGQWLSLTGNVSGNTYDTVSGADNMIGSIASGSTVSNP